CTGCGKIQYPASILKKNLSVEDCVHASDECGAPVVSIAGGEPLLHPQIADIARELVARKRFVYLCTNALLLERKLDAFQPSKYLSFSIHMDGPRGEAGASTSRPSSCNSSWESGTSNARRGETPRTTCSAGSVPATCCRTGTPRPSAS